MKYHRLHAKLIALSLDQSTTLGERLSAKNKAAQIHDKHLKPHMKHANRRNRRGNFRTSSPQFQFYASSIFADNPILKEQLKRAIFGVFEERDELKRKGEL